MSDERQNPPPARARAVADAPSAALAARAEELARRWALVLLGARSLEGMAVVPLGDFARYAPAVCESAARALSSEQELAAFELGGREPGEPGEPGRPRERGRAPGAAAAALGALAAGWDATTAVEHVEALRGVIWKAALDELADPSARQVADLSERLSSICAAVLTFVLAAAAAGTREGLAARRPPAPREQVLYSAPGPSPGTGAVLIDERAEAQHPAPRAAWRRAGGGGSKAPAPERGRAASEPPRAAPSPGRPQTAPRPLPWDTPLRSSVAPPPADASPADAPAPDALGESREDTVMRVWRGSATPADRRRS